MSAISARIRLPADEGAAARAIAFAWLFADRASLPQTASDRLAILVEEWVLNVVEHGQPSPGGRIGLVLQKRGDGIRLIFSDPGLAFDPTHAAFNGPNEERGGGVGLALLQAWTRTLQYRRRGGRNRLLLELKPEA